MRGSGLMAQAKIMAYIKWSQSTTAQPSNYGRGESGEASPISTENRDQDFFYPNLDFASTSGSPNLLEVGMEKSGFLTRLILTFLANFLKKSG